MNYYSIFLENIRINTDNFKVNPHNLVKLNLETLGVYNTFINGRECPYCGSHHVVSKGNYRGRKRYLCRKCSKSFNDFTNTPFNGIHNLEKLKKYLLSMINGETLRLSAEKADISMSTSFHWRHKILKAMKNIPSPTMKNVKEIEEIKLSFSAKGSRRKLPKKILNSKISTIFTCDRTGKVDSDAITYVKRSENPVLKRITQISDRHTEIIFANDNTKFKNITFDYFGNCNLSCSKSKVVSGIVNSWKVWMERFHGVASKYLSNYLHWFDFLDNSKFKTDRGIIFAELLFNI